MVSYQVYLPANLFSYVLKQAVVNTHKNAAHRCQWSMVQHHVLAVHIINALHYLHYHTVTDLSMLNLQSLPCNNNYYDKS